MIKPAKALSRKGVETGRGPGPNIGPAPQKRKADMSPLRSKRLERAKKLVSVVVPVYDNGPTLEALFRKFEETAEALPLYEFEFVFVDDGSRDNSYPTLLRYLGAAPVRVKVLRLSKNHGSFTACLAGLSKSEGDCAVLISADLQDPPALIPDMVRAWATGAEVIIAARRSRKDPLLTKLWSKFYYALFRKFALKEMPRGGFDFVLIDRKVVDILCEIREKNTSLMGLILWTGFKKETLYYDRQPRPRGKSRWTLAKKLKYFIDSFVAFSFTPIRFATGLGFTVSVLGSLYTLVIIADRLLNKNRIRGLTTLIALVLIIGGLILFMLGIIGEYLWRILDEVRKRPVFIIDEFLTNGPQRPKPKR
jgi:polyisoprenyl-phosphate glycosyltransferase